MVYRDPYAEQYDQRYTDAPGFGSYDAAQPHQPYDQGGYDPYGVGVRREDANSNPGGQTFPPGHHKAEVHYDQAAFARATSTGRCVINVKPLPNQGSEIIAIICQAWGSETLAL